MSKIFDYLENEDELLKKSPLIIGILSIFIFATGSSWILGMRMIWQIIVVLFLELLWIGYWCFKYFQLPTNKYKNKVGIILSIETESEKGKQRLKSDFVKRINNQVSENNLDDILNLVLANNHQAERINPFLNQYKIALKNFKNSKNPIQIPSKLQKRWVRFQRKTNGHLFIWGQIKERQDIDSTYFIEVNTIVVHPTLKHDYQKQLSEDMNSVWISLFKVLEKVEYKGFQFSADYIFLTVKYFVGMAVFMAGDVKSAFKLHKDLLKELTILKGHPNLPKIEKRLRKIISEENFHLARNCFLVEGNIAKSNEHLTYSFEHDPQNYSAHLLKGIIEFSAEGNIEKALKTIRRIKGFADTDGTWRYSEAFLLFYKDDFVKGLKVYDKIVNYFYDGEDFILNQVISFNKQILENEPEKIQSYFILGLLY